MAEDVTDSDTGDDNTGDDNTGDGDTEGSDTGGSDTGNSSTRSSTTDGTENDGTAGTGNDVPARTAEVPERVVLRIPGTGVLVALAFAVCVAPVALAAAPLLVLFLLPVAAGYWVVRNRTTVDGERLVARGTFRSHTLPWSEVTSLRVTERSWVRAVLADEREVTLPAVRLRHLPIMALVSGGRISDPAAGRDGGSADPPEAPDAE